MTEPNGIKRRGFASMDPERRRELCSKGGRAAHAKGRAHEWTKDEAKLAGSKGGRKTSADKEHMAKIGSKGGSSRVGNQTLIID